MKIIFKIGDIIHQSKDNLVFLVVNIEKQKVTLEYFDKSNDKLKCFTMTKNELVGQFKDKSEYLTLYKVSK